jgi:hypothetical protein
VVEPLRPLYGAGVSGRNVGSQERRGNRWALIGKFGGEVERGDKIDVDR